MVLIPDFYRGTFCDVTKEPGETIMAFLKSSTDLANLRKDFDNFVLPYAKKNGAESIGTFGFCWGSVPVVLFSSMDMVSSANKKKNQYYTFYFVVNIYVLVF